jgi:hypothetical protein
MTAPWPEVNDSARALGLQAFAERRLLPLEVLERVGATVVRVNGARRLWAPGWSDARAIDPDVEPKSWAVAGCPRGPVLMPDGTPVEGRLVVVAEGVTDGLAVLAERDDVVALALPSADSWRAEWRHRLAGASVVVLAHDPDAAGDRGRRYMADDLAGSSVNGRVRHLRGPDGVDLDDWRRADPVAFRQALDDATAEVIVPGPYVWAEPVAEWDPDDPGPIEPPDLEGDHVGDGSMVDRIRSRMLSMAQVLALPAPEALVAGLLDLDSLVFLYGRPKSFKSFAALDVALSVAAGMRWCGRPVTAVPVVYVVAEGVAGMGPRVEAWHQAHPMAGGVEGIRFYPVPLQLTDEHAVTSFIEVVRTLGARFVILDTLARCALGADENSSRDGGRLVEQADRIRQATGACVTLVHHAGKDASAGLRGSSAFLGAADLVIRCDAVESVVTLTVEDSKNHPTPAPIRLTVTPTGRSLVLVEATSYDPLKNAPKSVLDGLRALAAATVAGPVSWSAWRDSWDVSKATMYRIRADLVGLNLVRQVGSGKAQQWEVSPEGVSRLNDADQVG